MASRILLIIILSAADAWFTLHAVLDGRATEANPLMRTLLEHHAWTFISVKMLLTLLGVTILWRNKNRQLARQASWLAAACYCLLTAYHLLGWSL